MRTILVLVCGTNDNINYPQTTKETFQTLARAMYAKLIRIVMTLLLNTGALKLVVPSNALQLKKRLLHPLPLAMAIWLSG